MVVHISHDGTWEGGVLQQMEASNSLLLLGRKSFVFISAHRKETEKKFSQTLNAMEPHKISSKSWALDKQISLCCPVVYQEPDMDTEDQRYERIPCMCYKMIPCMCLGLEL